MTTGIAVLAVLATLFALHAGKQFLLPIVLAVMLKLLLQPVMDFLCLRLRLPTILAALVVIACLLAGVAAVLFAISGPASGWIEKAPAVLPTVKEKLAALREPIEYLQKIFKELADAATSGAGDTKVPTVAVNKTPAVASALASSGGAFLAGLFTTMIVLFFLLAAGERLLRGFIEVLPRFSDKRQAVDIASEIQRNIGGYLFTITIMNGLMGAAVGFGMWLCGLGDPVLWGAIAFLLNYVPVLGPVTGFSTFLIAGIVVMDWPWRALLPALVYLFIHVSEGGIITPLLLAKRFTLNPVLVIVSLFFWHAVWGIPGMLLAVPILATFKIVCDRIEPLRPAGHVIGA